jgi:hypothetical protein
MSIHSAPVARSHTPNDAGSWSELASVSIKPAAFVAGFEIQRKVGETVRREGSQLCAGASLHLCARKSLVDGQQPKLTNKV